MAGKENSAMTILMDFAKPCKGKLIGSVVLAVLGALCGMIPYIAVSRGIIMICHEDNDAPEFYLEPEQQAATLKGLRKQYRSSLMAPFIILAFHAFMAALVGGLFNGRWAAQLYRGLVEETAWVIGFCLFLLWAVFSDLWGFIYISRL